MSRVLALLECGCKLASILSDVRTRQQLIEENRYLVDQLKRRANADSRTAGKTGQGPARCSPSPPVDNRPVLRRLRGFLRRLLFPTVRNSLSLQRELPVFAFPVVQELGQDMILVRYEAVSLN